VELTPLRYLLAIGEAGHMTRAAESLGVSQPALSAAMKKLEDELGVTLLDRTGRGVALTEQGRAFCEHARAAVRAVDDGRRAVRELAGLERGTIRIGGGATAMGCLVPAAARAVRLEHPGLRFTAREAGSEQVAAAVVAGELDLGIVTLPVRTVGRDELMVVHRVDDELRLILPPGHRLAGREAFAWSDLAGEPVVAFEAGSAVRTLIDAAAGEHGVTLSVVMELRSIQGIERMVEAGIGVGFVSRLALGDGDGPLGAGLPCADGVIRRELAVVRRRDRTPSPAAAAFERALVRGREPRP
jgi:DNA-binding transcriptional LysR family regulator